MPTNVKSEAEKYAVALDAFPEFATQVGILISCFALIEAYMHKLVGLLTKMDEADAFVVSGSFSSFGARIDLLENLAKKKLKQKSKVVIASSYFAKTMREASQIRNIYAHGTYSLGNEKGKKVMYITPFLYDAKRKKATRFVRDLEYAKVDVERIKFITCEFHGYLYRDEMPEISKKKS